MNDSTDLLQNDLINAWTAATGTHPTDCVMVTQKLEDGRTACWIQPKKVIPLAAANLMLDRVRELLEKGPGSDSWREALNKAVNL
jgi:hypothetical protein